MDETIFSPIRLSKMTLRGVGSYLHGAALEIRPITIICGTNGSGKSTWLRMLDVLKDSFEEGMIPFGFAGYLKSATNYAGITNAWLSTGFSKAEIVQYIQDSSETYLYGPCGTIGLEFQVADDATLPGAAICKHVPRGGAEVAADFLESGLCRNDLKLRVRMAHPSFDMTCADDSDFEFDEYFELTINDGIVFRFQKNGQQQHYVFSSSGWLSSFDNQTLARVFPKLEGPGRERPYLRPREYNSDQLLCQEAQFLCDAVILRIRELVAHVVNRYFHLGAVRRVHDEADVCSPSEDSILRQRYVGFEGEHTILLERRYAGSFMSQPVSAKAPPLPEDERPDAFVTKATLRVESVYHKAGPINEGYLFCHYYNEWLKRLLNICAPPYDSASDCSGPLRGSLVSFEPVYLPDDPTPDPSPDDVCIYTNDFFGGISSYASPVHMSSGFHQVAPMIVQTGLMLQNEIMAVENPEVHLHPSLQLRIMEFFLEQAKAGKFMLIETHSDLIVRRLLREILMKEGISQENARIYFVSSVQKHDFEWVGSSCKAIEVDAAGRIKWPPGFLDDDVKESRRMLEVMYGGQVEEEEDFRNED